MKLFFTVILLFTSIGFTKTKALEPKANLAKTTVSKSDKKKSDRKISSTSDEYNTLLSGFSGLNKSNIDKNFNAAADGIEKFSEVKLLVPENTPLVILVLKAVVLIDDLDPSRSTPQMLTGSYHTNKTIYQEAFKSLSTDEKKIIKEIFEMFGGPDKRGNG
jgi:hypothetical protein